MQETNGYALESAAVVWCFFVFFSLNKYFSSRTTPQHPPDVLFLRFFVNTETGVVGTQQQTSLDRLSVAVFQCTYSTEGRSLPSHPHGCW